MPTQPIHTLQSKHFVVVLIYTLGVALFAAAGIRAQQMQKGVSVQMAQTQNAASYPDADAANAWIVTVTADGHLSFGVKSVTPQQLFETMEATPRHRDAKLYIKADVQSTFASLKTALGPARTVHFDDAVLLTSQPPEQSRKGIVSPQGIDVQIVPQRQAAIDVRLSRQSEASQVMVNGKPVDWTQLESSLKNLVRPKDVVQVEAADGVPFADVIRVLDAAHRTGAALAVPSYHSI